MTLQEKLDLVTNYFADNWAIDKAMQLLEDYDSVRTVQPQENAWQQAIDHELVMAHLGVAGPATFEHARKALHELICWHVDVATDPATNGGKVLVDAASTPADSVTAPAVETINLPDGATLKKEKYTFTSPDKLWALYRGNSLVRWLNPFERNFIDAALDAARKQGCSHD